MPAARRTAHTARCRLSPRCSSKIQSDYVTDPNISDVTTGALHGLLESLDADSSYLTPTEYKIYKERPATGVAQVGITVSKRYGYATVVSVLPGSPADKEHLADGDVIESIGEQSTRELSLAVIRLMLEGKPGTTVTLSVVRPRKPEPDKLTLTRAIAATPALGEQQYENSTILYLKPGVLTAARVDEIAAKLKAAGKDRKVLLDLARFLRRRRAARACVWPTSSSSRARWPRSKARSFPRQTFSRRPGGIYLCRAAGRARQSRHLWRGRVDSRRHRGREARRCGGRANLRRGLGAEDHRTARRRRAAAHRGQVRRPGRQEDRRTRL